MFRVKFYFVGFLCSFFFAAPPDEDDARAHLAPIQDQSKLSLFSGATTPEDWLDFSRTRSAQSIAEKTCEMICYMWFGSGTVSSNPTSLQLQTTPTFVQFMHKLLETTQVSQSVIVLSLHYIFRLKVRNKFTPAQPGSEFRIAVAGLMMANKFLDEYVL